MPYVHGIEFPEGQSVLVEELIQELLNEGQCAVYALPYISPGGELRLACGDYSRRLKSHAGVFLRICPGPEEATAIRPLHAITGVSRISITESSRTKLLDTIRVWRWETRIACA